jgi:arylformamidase
MTSKGMSHNRMTRRVFLGGGTAVALIAAAKTGLAQQSTPAPQTPPPQGPLVWLNLDQAELDAAYDQSVWAPNSQQIQNRYATNSNDVRTRLSPPQRYAYGATPIEELDVYRAERHNAPINIFIHGGAWRSGLAKDYAFPAELFVHAGVHFVVLDFA